MSAPAGMVDRCRHGRRRHRPRNPRVGGDPLRRQATPHLHLDRAGSPRGLSCPVRASLRSARPAIPQTTCDVSCLPFTDVSSLVRLFCGWPNRDSAGGGGYPQGSPGLPACAWLRGSKETTLTATTLTTTTGTLATVQGRPQCEGRRLRPKAGIRRFQEPGLPVG